MPDDGPVCRDQICGPPGGSDFSVGDSLALGAAFGHDAEATDTSAELRRGILELEHRLKNVLSNVLALVGRAERDATDDKDVLKTLSLRVKALAGPQTFGDLTGRREVEFSALLAVALTDVFGDERISLQGASLRLNARAARALESVFHELATNAAKYGALSKPDGRIELSWSCLKVGGENIARIRWKEFGGPKVSAEPGAGFGTQLISSLITGDLKGGIKRDWNSAGVIVEFILPFDEICAASENDATADF